MKTKKPQHTPGPWTHEGSEDCAGEWILARNGEDMIAQVDGFNGIGKKESEANARLIAAAPGLLNAAKWAENALRQPQDKFLAKEALEHLRATIAEAEGDAK